MSNTITNYIPLILANIQLSLSNNLRIMRMFGQDYGPVAAGLGDSITINLQNEASTSAVVAGPAYDGTGRTNLNPTKVSLNLDQWRKSDFAVTDKEIREMQAGVIPAAIDSAVKALLTEAIAFIAAKASVAAKHAVGVAGTTPFASDHKLITKAGRVLDSEKMMGMREFLVNEYAKENLLNLALFHQADQRGDNEGLVEGYMGRKFGFDFDWYQSMPADTASGVVGDPVISAAAVGATTIEVTCDADDTVDLVEGDVINTGTAGEYYVVDAAVSIASSAAGNVTIKSGLLTATAGTENLTNPVHTANLAFQRDMIQFVNRPTRGSLVPNAIVESIVDPVTGLAIQFEMKRENHQDGLFLSMLYGGAAVRDAGIVKVLG